MRIRVQNRRKDLNFLMYNCAILLNLWDISAFYLYIIRNYFVDLVLNRKDKTLKEDKHSG